MELAWAGREETTAIHNLSLFVYGPSLMDVTVS